MNAHTSIHCEGDYRRAEATIRQQAEQIDQLRYEVEFYKREAGLLADADNVDMFQERFGLTTVEASASAALYQRRGKWLPGATLEGLLDEVRGHPVESNIVAVVISKIRRKLGDTWVENLWKRGYRFSDTALAEIDRRFSPT
jgi:DNA-binding response OmpR family regulator